MMGYVSAVVRNKYPKINVNLIEIKLVEYQLYLKANGLDDNPAERAKYITLKTNGKCFFILTMDRHLNGCRIFKKEFYSSDKVWCKRFSPPSAKPLKWE